MGIDTKKPKSYPDREGAWVRHDEIEGMAPIAHFSPRQREHIATLLRPDIGWRVSSIELARDDERLTINEPPPQEKP